MGVAKVPVIDFKREVSGKVLTDSLINEIKSLLFTLIYLSSNNGRTGRLSAIIAYQYFRILRNVGFFCIDQSNSVLQGISIREVLSNANYLSIFVETQSNSALKILSDLLLNLNNTENRFLDFTPVNKKLFDVDYRYKQTPVIPSRIYIELMNILGSEIDFIYCFKNRLFNFIKEFKNEKIGYGIDTQLNTIKGLGIRTVFYQRLMN